VNLDIAVPPRDRLDVALRRILPADINFIMNSWKKSYRQARPEWSDKFYYHEMGRRITKILERHPRVRLAVNPLDLNYIYGWVVAQPPVLHYLYVKEAYRPAGVSLQLIAEVGLSLHPTIFATHWTPAATRLQTKLPCIHNIET